MEKKLIGLSLQLKQLKCQLKITKKQRQVLVGSLLGDGSLEKNGHNSRFIFGQGDKHKVYLDHVYQIFAPLALNSPRVYKRKSGLLHRFATLSLPCFAFYYSLFYKNGKKRISKTICRYLTPCALAYWYMDDGSMKSKQSKGLILNTHCFSREECLILCECLQTKFQIKSWPRIQRDYKRGVLRIYYQIYISGLCFERMDQLISPYLLQEMRYKWPLPRLRNCVRHT